MRRDFLLVLLGQRKVKLALERLSTSAKDCLRRCYLSLLLLLHHLHPFFPRLSVSRCLLLPLIFFLPVLHHRLVELIVFLAQIGLTLHFSPVNVFFCLFLGIHLLYDVAILSLHLLLQKLVELVLRGYDAFDVVLDVLLCDR